MSMFQNSVLKSFTQDESIVALRFAQYQKYKEKINDCQFLYIKSVKSNIKICHSYITNYFLGYNYKN